MPISFVLDHTLCRTNKWTYIYFVDLWLGTAGQYLASPFQRNVYKDKVENGLPSQEVEFSHNNI